MLQYQSVSHELKNLLDQLMQLDELSDFVLVGGTSLGLRYGHRISVDIDLFPHSSFNVDDLDRILESVFPDSILLIKERNGVTRIINQIKVDLYYFGSQFIRKYETIDGIRISSVEDLSGFKFESLVRLERKDFIDIAVILEHFTFNEMVNFYKEKYQTHDIRMVFDNLLKFKEAEITPMPVILIPRLTWEYSTNKILAAFSEYKSSILEEKKKKEDFRMKKAEDLVQKKRNRLDK